MEFWTKNFSISEMFADDANPLPSPSVKSWEECDKLEYSLYSKIEDASTAKTSLELPALTESLKCSEPSVSFGGLKMDFRDDPCKISESLLVRYSLYALQGVSSAVDKLNFLSEHFSSQPADRNRHSISGLWMKSSSTRALGKMLRVIADSGRICCHLVRFVEYFTSGESKKISWIPFVKDIHGFSNHDRKMKGHTQGNGDLKNCTGLTQSEVTKADIASCPPFSLVNQAFAIALKRLLEGYVAALNTLTASIVFRRSGELDCGTLEELGCLTSVVPRQITLLELYLHTAELRIHIQALGQICMLTQEGCSQETRNTDTEQGTANNYFQGFPKGAELLTYLYGQLREADPMHCGLLKFLFARACQPYFTFIKSWLYHASVKDPYREFFVEASDDLKSFPNSWQLHKPDLQASAIRVRDGVSIPSFLKEACTPLLRAGQQLQVLLKLLEKAEAGKDLAKFLNSCMDSSIHFLSLSKDDLSDGCASFLKGIASHRPVLVYSRNELEDLMKARDTENKQMIEKLENAFSKIENLCGLNEQTMLGRGLYADVQENNPDVGIVTSSVGSEYVDHFFEISDDDDDSILVSSECDGSSSTQSETDEVSSIHRGSKNSQKASAWCAEQHLFTDKIQNSPMTCLSRERVKTMEDQGSIHVPSLQSKCNSFKFLDKSLSREENQVLEHSSLSSLKKYDEPEKPFAFLPEEVSVLPSSLLSGIFLDFHCSKQKEGYADQCTDLDLHEKPFPVESLCSYLKSFNDIPNKCKSSMQESSIGKIGNGCSADYQTSCALMSFHPMLTRRAWLHLHYLIPEKSLGGRNMLFYPRDFSSMTLPFESFLGTIPLSHSFVNPSLSSVADGDKTLNNNLSVGQANGTLVSNAEEKATILKGTRLPVEASRSESEAFNHSSDAGMDGESPVTMPSGGAKWETTLNYPGFNFMHKTEVQNDNTDTALDIPLDVVLDQCILQEILLQYQSISKFTVKLFVEGLGLQQHLLAFRRYFLMESGDWADEFLMHLCHHKWSPKGSHQQVLELQMMLKSSLEGTSCDGDEHAERLYAYISGGDELQNKNTASRIHNLCDSAHFINLNSIKTFDIFGLGYRLDWPLNTIISTNSLSMYSKIFQFLLQIRMAMFSVRAIWNKLKELTRYASMNRNQESIKDDEFQRDIRMLMQFGQQINHFMGALQLYVQSQLLHAVWHKFLHSFESQVNDMLDLETVHESYLLESLHICFLSPQMGVIKELICCIMQRALDFGSCFHYKAQIFEDNNEFSFVKAINFSQVWKIKCSFEQNLKQLYENYIKFGKQTDSSLSYFWMYLDYNEFISNVLTTKSK